MYNYYISQIEYLKELIEDSISLQEETKSFMEDGKLINAYNKIKELNSKLTSMRFRIEGMEGNMKLDNKRAEPIRNAIINEIVSTDGYDEYSREYLSDSTDMYLIQELQMVSGSVKLHKVLNSLSTSNK